MSNFVSYFRKMRALNHFMGILRLLLLLIVLSPSLRAQPPTVLFESGTPIDGVNINNICQAVINNSRQVVFAATFSPPNEGARFGIFSPQRALVLSRGDVYALAMNNNGTIVFSVVPRDGSPNAIYAYELSTGELREVIRSGTYIDGFRLDAVWSPAINDVGEIVFYGVQWPPEGEAIGAIFSTTHLIVSPSQTINGIQLRTVGYEVLNSQGIVFFNANVDKGMAIMSTAGLIIGFWDRQFPGKEIVGVGPISVNNSGQLVFLGVYKAPGSPAYQTKNGIFDLNGHEVVSSQEVADGMRIANPWAPSINDRGDLVFSSPFEKGNHEWGYGVFLKVLR